MGASTGYVRAGQVARRETDAHKLGPRQARVLEALLRHGSWSCGGGWVWDTSSGTDRTLRSLARRGLVEVTTDRDRSGYGQYRPIQRLRNDMEAAR